jgi:proteic killer suppression protein
MIVSFGSKETEKIWNGERVKKLPNEIQEIGRRKLRMLNNSQNMADSIRINDQWRIIFKWNNANASEVEILDYH